MPDISERAFEDAIVAALVRGGGPFTIAEENDKRDEPSPFYLLHKNVDYDPELCLLPDDVMSFVQFTQPHAWEKLKLHHGDDARRHFLRRLARQIDRKGTLEVLRRGVKDTGVKFRLAYFKPHSGLNPESRRRYQANFFSVTQQLHYGAKGGEKDGERGVLDLVLFLNGLPLFTAELKNRLSGQNVKHAIEQYKRDRDPREPLFAFGRCLAHFAVDPDLAFMTTRLAGPKTRFLPFNQGYNRGAGNPPGKKTEGGYATAYLWEKVWAKDSVLNLIQHFVHRVQKEDAEGKTTQIQLFPRYHQLRTVRRLVDHARVHGTGHEYLIQHSAGSGKSFTIAWLAHWLSVLHDDEDRRVFDSIVVITDRRVLDQQLQETVRQFEQTLGVVEAIDRDSEQLRTALAEGKTIIVTTLQKFPVVARELVELSGQRFAILVDEAHSSQTGESSKDLKAVLSSDSLETAEATDTADEETHEDRVVAEMEKRGKLPNASTFAFTATPKQKTLELFGERQADGSFAPFSLYSMRQAIEENFILDVLENYTTYSTYWKLLKKVEEDPRYERKKAQSLLKSFVSLNQHAIGHKVEIMVEHFHEHVAHRVAGRAKAMIVTRSRLHCVRYKQALDRVLRDKGLPYETLVAFSGKVEDGDLSYTESQMNGVPESRTKTTFERPEVRFLVVANKFQTGFDQPLLHTMYVDKQLGGVNAVQTLSRLNRTHPDKEGTMVLDFANEAETIRRAFEPYYETTLLSEGTDPNSLYDRQHELEEFGVFTEHDVEDFARLFFTKDTPQDQIYASLAPVKKRAEAQLSDEEMGRFRTTLKSYTRLYAFLSQVIPFTDPDLEKLYAFARLLRRYLDAPAEELPREIQDNIDMDSLRVQRTFSGGLRLERGENRLDPLGERQGGGPQPEELEPLSEILRELNERYGSDLGPEDRITFDRLLDDAEGDELLRLNVENNPEENARLAFQHRLTDMLQDVVDTNFQLYKRLQDDRDFAHDLMRRLFDEYRRRLGNGGLSEADLLREIADGETKHRELKSSLRWNLHSEENDDRITHSALKTLAAFQNTEGGVLYLGVADDGTVVGIGHDGFANDDKFLLHLNNVAKNWMGKPAAARLNPRIWRLDGKAVCRVECPPSPKPVFLTFRGEEKFYVRSGPGTEAMTPSEMNHYAAERFGR